MLPGVFVIVHDIVERAKDDRDGDDREQQCLPWGGPGSAKRINRCVVRRTEFSVATAYLTHQRPISTMRR